MPHIDYIQIIYRLHILHADFIRFTNISHTIQLWVYIQITHRLYTDYKKYIMNIWKIYFNNILIPIHHTLIAHAPQLDVRESTPAAAAMIASRLPLVKPLHQLDLLQGHLYFGWTAVAGRSRFTCPSTIFVKKICAFSCIYCICTICN